MNFIKIFFFGLVVVVCIAIILEKVKKQIPVDDIEQRIESLDSQ